MPILLKNYLADETGATAVEYGILAAAIGLAIVAAVAPLGDFIDVNFGELSGAIRDAN